MHFLNKYSLSLFLFMGLHISWSNPVTLLKKHQYFKAIKAWEEDASLKKTNAQKLKALKGQAIAYRHLGNLYSVFYNFSKELYKEYYHTIGKSNASTNVVFYKGQMEFYSGNYQLTIKLMEKVIRDNRTRPKFRELAKVYRHFSLNKIHRKKGRFNMHSSFPSVTWQIHELDDSKSLPVGTDTPDIRSHRNKLRILIRQNNSTEKQIKTHLQYILNKGEEAEFFVNRGKLTQINFFDPLILETLAKSFYWLSGYRYEIIKKYEDEFPELVKKFKTDFSLAEVNYHLGKLSKAEKYLKSVKSVKGKLLQAKIEVKKSNHKKARNILKGIEKKAKEPALLRDLGYTYFETGLSNRKGLKYTQKALRKKKSSAYYRRYANILFSIGKTQESLETFGKGYKIQYRNSSIHNDPEYMIDYAQAIFLATKMRYDEVIETLYHIQKVYPVTRSLHYSMQGIAAANTNTFQSEKIFRKGG